MPAFLRRIGDEHAVVATVAAVTFALAYDQGAYSLSSRAIVAIATWWAVVFGIAVGAFSPARLRAPVRLVGLLLAAFAAWTLASALWAADNERPLVEFDRVSLYLGLFILAALVESRTRIGAFAAGAAIGITAVAITALLSQSFPAIVSTEDVRTFVPNAAERLSFPIGYWNGLAIFVSFGYPLCLGLALRATRVWTRALALGSTPLFGAVIYLTSSRGGIATACIGTAVFLGLTDSRARAWTAVLVSTGGSIAGVAVLDVRSAHLDAVGFLLVLVAASATAAVFGVAQRLPVAFQPGKTAVRTAAVIGTIALLVGATAAHPGDRLESFGRLPAGGNAAADSIHAHLLSGSGSGRWQFWTSAFDEWQSAPLIGRGAGSYEAWWAEHASFTYFVRNAHSLYLEVLGELGAVGFVLLIGGLLAGAVFAVGSTRRSHGKDRITSASLAGVVFAFYVGAAIDWIWQLTAVAGVGVVALGLLTGRRLGARSTQRDVRARPLLALAAATLGAVVIAAQALPWLTELEVSASRAAVRGDDGRAALRHAFHARSLQPWAASPYLQLALVQERLGDIAAARMSIRAALRRSPEDWRLWLVSARVAVEAGAVDAGRRSLERASTLNPRSPLFAPMHKLPMQRRRRGG
jgi:O-antigen ligase